MIVNKQISYSEELGKYCIKISTPISEGVEHTFLEFLAADKQEASLFIEKLKKDVKEMFDECLYRKVALN